MNAAATKLALSKTPAEAQHPRRDELILEHLHIVTAIAGYVQRSLPVHVELDDLIHAGTMGLIDAATKYREDKEVSFPSYAKHRIRGAILDSLRQIDWASRDLRKRYKQMKTVTAELTDKLGRKPTDAEIAARMGLSQRRWHMLMVDFRSLGAAASQAKITDREDQPMREVACAAEKGPDRVLARAEMRERLSSAMQTLPQKYRQVVKLYYEGDMTMKEIGSILGVNESRVSQMRRSALARMQAALGAAGITSAAAF
jgi:RNA polymerase sigma factor FliA